MPATRGVLAQEQRTVPYHNPSCIRAKAHKGAYLSDMHFMVHTNALFTHEIPCSSILLSPFCNAGEDLVNDSISAALWRALLNPIPIVRLPLFAVSIAVY
jgi:hypothetical protein